MLPESLSGHLFICHSCQQFPPQLVLGLGLTLVITSGEIDLSFSAVVAFSGFLFSYVFRTFSTPWLALLVALCGGVLVGVINGILIAKIGVPSIMATLAAQFFWNGLTILLCGGLSWNIKEIRGTPIHELFVGRLFGMKFLSKNLFAVLIVSFLLLIGGLGLFAEG